MAAVIAAQRAEPLSYGPVGDTAEALPEGWYQTRRTVVLGHGAGVWARALVALRGWRMFEMEWVSLTQDGPPSVGQVVALTSRQLGVWGVHVVRVVDVWERTEADGARRAGFAYGTLPHHAVRGEERFEVGMDPDGQVWFAIRQFSQPSSWLTTLVPALGRRIQDAFVDSALTAFSKAVSA